MEQTLLKWIGLAALAGALLPAQAAINAQLAKGLGHPVLATVVSFIIGTLAIVAYAIGGRIPLPTMAQASSLPWWSWIGGLLGAVFVTLAALLAPRLGTAALTGFVVAGQLLVSLLLDHYGWFGLPIHELSWARGLGVVLMLLGVFCILKF